MPSRPNILFLMTDQMQGRVLDPAHPCVVPAFDRLRERGTWFRNAYTPNAVCSPARASLMTGLLPHNHGVTDVTHTVADDQSCLRADRPHWAQRLREAGYRTGYFGKWHVERSHDLARFGWETFADESCETTRAAMRAARARAGEPQWSREFMLKNEGYGDLRFYGVRDTSSDDRGMGVHTQHGLAFLDTALGRDEPWCCFVSVTEPHDPFYCSREAYDQYDPETLPLPHSAHDPLDGRPNVYRKAARIFASMDDHHRREAAACYYASITEIDRQFARLIERVERAGQLDNTLVILTADHGEFLGAHGLYCKNVGAYEEVYNIPLLMAGPGVKAGQVSTARVGLHDLAQTILDLTGCPGIECPDSRSFRACCEDAAAADDGFRVGYAEYYGTRYPLCQRVVYDGPWKFVLNGFDFDELYNLQDDPDELRNRAEDPACAGTLKRMAGLLWDYVRRTDDKTLLNTQYPVLRLAPVGPGEA